jgi:hypothetical protein
MVFSQVSGENVKSSVIKVNDEKIFMSEDGVSVKEGDDIYVKITPISTAKQSTLFIDGFSPNTIYDVKDNNVESTLDYKNLSYEIDVQ